MKNSGLDNSSDIGMIMSWQEYESSIMVCAAMETAIVSP